MHSDFWDEADLRIVKTADPAFSKQGEPAAYTLAVTNHSPFDAENIVIEDRLEGMSGTQYSDDLGLTWDGWRGSYSLAYLAAGDSFTLLLRGTRAPYCCRNDYINSKRESIFDRIAEMRSRMRTRMGDFNKSCWQ